jgi:GNAT superfamily N-acetyltransferase
MSITLHAVDELTAPQKSARQHLSHSVYPPNQPWAGSAIEWASGQWCAVCWNNDQQALSSAGAVIRQALLNDAAVTIGGIGGVMTHPDARGQGLAASAIECLIDFFKDHKVDFALLVCEPHLIPFYQRLGWQPFAGDLFVTQNKTRCRFTFNLSMVLPVSLPAPTEGTIDLLGPPW